MFGRFARSVLEIPMQIACHVDCWLMARLFPTTLTSHATATKVTVMPAA
jgi:hypothetical protein